MGLEDEEGRDDWTIVKKGSKLNSKKITVPNYIDISNRYATLLAFSVPPDPHQPHQQPILPDPSLDQHQSRYRLRIERRRQARLTKKIRNLCENDFFDEQITRSEDERTVLAKNDSENVQRMAIDTAHSSTTPNPLTVLQRGVNAGYNLSTKFCRAIQHLKHNNQPIVRFASKPEIVTFRKEEEATMVTYDSGADGHYFSEADRKRAGLPILRRSTKQVGVANGGTSSGKYVTQLPFPKLSPKAAEAETFDDFSSSLLSVGKTADDGNISIFTKEGVTVHKEEDILITCHGEPILIGTRDDRGRYRIPLQQRRGQWQPRRPSKKARKVLREANNVYDLPSTEQAIKWMHAVCGYPVKSTWLAAFEAGNYVGWPLLTTRNVKKYYPKTTETPKGHTN